MSRYPLRDSIGISQGKRYEADINSVSKAGVQAAVNTPDRYHTPGLGQEVSTGDYGMSSQQRVEQAAIKQNRKSTDDNLSPNTVDYLSHNIKYPIKHDEGTAYQHHGTGFEELKHQPVNSAKVFEKDAKKDRSNPQYELHTKIVAPSTTIDPKTDPRIYKLDNSAQYDPSQQAALQTKAARFKGKEKLFPTTTNKETSTYKPDPVNLNLNVYDSSAKLTSKYQKAFLNHPNGDQRTDAVDYTDNTAITPLVGGENMQWTVHGRPNEYLRNSSTLLSIDDSIRSAEGVGNNQLPYQDPMSVGPVWKTIHGGMEQGFTELPEKKCNENGSQQDPTLGEAPLGAAHKWMKIDVQEKNTPSAEKQVTSQIIGMANSGVLAEQMASGVLNNYPHIGPVISEHRKGYMPPIEVDKISSEKLRVKQLPEKSIKEKINKNK